MIRKKIIVDIPFNEDYRKFQVCEPQLEQIYNRSFAIAQTREWIDYRMDIFMKYTGVSLKCQTNQDFLCVVRYTKQSEEFIQEAIARYPKLSENIIFTCEADTIIKEAIKDYDYIYHVRVDSDNMYHSDFIQKIDLFPYEEGLECLLCQQGYIYETTTHKLAEIFHFSPSFYVYIFKRDDYLINNQYRVFENHFRAIQHKHHIVEGRNYMIVIHEKNLDNKYEIIVAGYNARRIEALEEKNAILRQWHIESEGNKSETDTFFTT